MPSGSAGDRYIEELNEAGGILAVMNEISKLGLLHTELMTCTGKTVAENIQGHEIRDTEIIRPVTDPYSKTGGIAVLKGNLAPDGSVVKAFCSCAGDASPKGKGKGV